MDCDILESAKEGEWRGLRSYVDNMSQILARVAWVTLVHKFPRVKKWRWLKFWREYKKISFA